MLQALISRLCPSQGSRRSAFGSIGLAKSWEPGMDVLGSYALYQAGVRWPLGSRGALGLVLCFFCSSGCYYEAMLIDKLNRSKSTEQFFW